MDENWNAWPEDDEDQKRRAAIEEMMRSQRDAISATSPCSRNTATS
jgi:hypothetical protein